MAELITERLNYFFEEEGIKIPTDVFFMILDRKLSYRQALLYLLIRGLNDPKQGCWASNAILGQRVGLVTRSVQRGIDKLLELNLIERSPTENGRTLRPLVYKCTRDKNVIPPTTKMSPKDIPNPNPPNDYAESASRTSANRISGNGKEPNNSSPAKKPAGLFPVEEGKNSPTEKDLFRAKRLRDHNAKYKERFISRSPKKWAVAFRALRIRLGSDEAKIDIVLDMATDPASGFVVYDGASLASAGVWNEAMRRIAAKEKKNPTVEVTPLALETVTMLRKLGWPKGSDKQLPVAVQLGIDNAKKFRDFIKSKCSADGREFCERKLFPILRDYQNLVYIYMKYTNKRLRNWSKWNGELLPRWVWTVEEFAKDGADLAKKWGNPLDWDRLLMEYQNKQDTAYLKEYNESHQA